MKTTKEHFEINWPLAPIVCFPELVSGLNWFMGCFGSTTYTAVSTLQTIILPRPASKKSNVPIKECLKAYCHKIYTVDQGAISSVCQERIHTYQLLNWIDAKVGSYYFRDLCTFFGIGWMKQVKRSFLVFYYVNKNLNK